MATRTSQASGGFRADDADTWGLGSGVYPATTDDIIIAAGHNITLKEDNEVAYFQQQGSSGNESTLTLGSNTLTINSRNSSNSRVILIDNEHCNIAANTGKIKLTGSADASHKLVGLQHFADELHDLEVHTSGSNPTYRQESAVTINGDFTITAGGWTTNTSNHALTVDGDVSVTGTLTGNASAISMGSLKIDDGGTYTATSGITTLTNKRSETSVPYQLFVHSNGTFTNSNGTLKDTFNDTAHRWAMASGDSLYKAIIENASGITRLDGDLDIANDLDVVEGTIRQHGSGGTGDLTVDGDVSIEDGGTIGGNNDAGDYTFGSLTIASGGTYSATSGTTIIKGALRNVGGTIS